MSRKLLFFLLCIDAVLILQHIFLGDRFDLFNLDRERTFAAYYSGLKLMAIAALAFGMVFLTPKNMTRLFWSIFSFIFVTFSFDEVSELHENVTYYFMKYVAPLSWFRVPTYYWLLFFSPAIIAIFIFFFFFLIRLRRETYGSWRILSCGICILLSAVLLEFLGGLSKDAAWLWFEVLIEEGLEMIGATVILVGVFLIAHRAFDAQYVRRI